MVYTIKETESLSMKGGKSQLSTAVLEDCKTCLLYTSLVLGDWSKDGHKQSEDFLFDCNYDVHKIRQAYKDSCKKLGVAFHDEDYENCTKPLSDDYSNVWTDYETPYIDETDYEILNRCV